MQKILKVFLKFHLQNQDSMDQRDPLCSVQRIIQKHIVACIFVTLSQVGLKILNPFTCLMIDP